MNRLFDVLFHTLGSVVTFGVPAIVWTFLMAGCCQLAREQVRRLRIAPQSSLKLTQESTS